MNVRGSQHILLASLRTGDACCIDRGHGGHIGKEVVGSSCGMMGSLRREPIMPFEGKTVMDHREDFVRLAREDGANIRALCRQYHLSPTTAYTWLARAEAVPPDPLADRSRRPHTSPGQTDPHHEAQVVALRDLHPTWGPRKLRASLLRRGETPPAASTITTILHRHHRITLEPPPFPVTVTRFVRPEPNELWQLDFMGHRPLQTGRVHPLSLLDDHSRFGLALVACANERRITVEAHLTEAFVCYGLPDAILADNGAPWGMQGSQGLTRLEVWLMRLGVRLLHGRAYHPQTQGKIERWHRTINHEVFRLPRFADCPAAQDAFDRFRTSYTQERPHHELAHAVPADHDVPSRRPFPATLPEIVYPAGDTIRRVGTSGTLQLAGQRVFVSEGLAGQRVGLRPTATDGVLTVHLGERQVATITLRDRS
jgi:transposase InsO family protein